MTNLVKNGLDNNETIKTDNIDEDIQNNTTRVYELEQSVVFSAMENPEMKPEKKLKFQNMKMEHTGTSSLTEL